MGSSVQAGVAALTDLPRAPEQVLLMVCDQPLLEGDDFRELAEAARNSPSGIAATSYSGYPGVPACFSWRHRERLMQIDPSRGARALLGSLEDVALVELLHAEIDIDEPGQAEELRLAIEPG